MFFFLNPNNKKLFFPTLGFRKTLGDCMGPAAMQYIGAVHDGQEALETLQFFSALLLSQLAAMSEVDAYHRFWPWNVVAAFSPCAVPALLSEMKDAWVFCTEFVDGLPSTDKLHTWFSFTRYQSFRDVFVKAEKLSLRTFSATSLF